MAKRPDPDELLVRIQEEEARQQRGRLKIFLGYAAGVGKTYAMLEAANQRKTEGVDVIAAYVETHGRAETETLLEGLEIIPRQEIVYRGVHLTEMALDAVLARHPALALVDELAHTNAPGSRHLKRYQDVQELLAAGIDVYTTLNIQHLESLNDVVAQITGVTIRETAPDRVIDEADELEVIDLPPEELRRRLEDGKVYIPEQAVRAMQRFFRRGNLTALREITLRRIAERVGDQMRAYMQTHAIPGPWRAEERVLACVSSHPLAGRLVRSARRLADELDADWMAIYVETPGDSALSEEGRDRVARALRLAEELGARTIRLPGSSVAEAVLYYARTHNITQIIIGKPPRPRWVELLRGSVTDEIIRHSGNIDVHVISTEQKPQKLLEALTVAGRSPWQSYVLSAAVVIGFSLFGELIDRYFAPTNLVMLYLLAVVIIAVWLGRGPAILAAVLSVATFDFFFVPPRYTLAVGDLEYLLTFAALLLVGLVISALAARAREQVETARRHEFQTAALYDLSRELAASAPLDSIVDIVAQHISRMFECQAAILLPQADRLVLQIASPGFGLDEDEMAVADWVYRHGQPAGRATDTLPAAEASYLPLKTVHGTVGVLGVAFVDSGKKLTSQQRRQLEASTNLIALAIERARFVEEAGRVRLLQETEKLQSALLNSISHDLRTPLAAITGALSSLKDDSANLDEATQHDLVETALEQAERLNRLVGNLLDMTRLEAGAIKIVREPCDVQEVIGVALQDVLGGLRRRGINVAVSPGLPLALMDMPLISRVLVNLLDNAIKYSPADAPVEIRAYTTGAHLEIAVADRGVGIPGEDLARIFDKFYRVRRPDNVSGTGLGLSISKGIVEAHGGHIWAEAREGGGTVVTVSLPLGDSGGQEAEVDP